MRRVLAYLTDWLIHYLALLLCVAILRIPSMSMFTLFFIAIAAIGFFVTIVMRDYLFNGRSLGKRIFKLRVVDAKSRSLPSAKQLIVKNLFLFLYPIDGLVLLITGRSLGERISDTLVVQGDPQPDPEAPEVTPTPIKKRIARAVTVVLCIAIPMVLLISSLLEHAKKQENYDLAHHYLVSSKSFDQIHAEESQIILTGYAYNGTGENGESTHVTFTFNVRGWQYAVVCHPDSDGWYVCMDCTKFR